MKTWSSFDYYHTELKTNGSKYVTMRQISYTTSLHWTTQKRKNEKHPTRKVSQHHHHRSVILQSTGTDSPIQRSQPSLLIVHQLLSRSSSGSILVTAVVYRLAHIGCAHTHRDLLHRMLSLWMMHKCVDPTHLSQCQLAFVR